MLTTVLFLSKCTMVLEPICSLIPSRINPLWIWINKSWCRRISTTEEPSWWCKTCTITIYTVPTLVYFSLCSEATTATIISQPMIMGRVSRTLPISVKTHRLEESAVAFSRTLSFPCRIAYKTRIRPSPKDRSSKRTTNRSTWRTSTPSRSTTSPN